MVLFYDASGNIVEEKYLQNFNSTLVTLTKCFLSNEYTRLLTSNYHQKID